MRSKSDRRDLHINTKIVPRRSNNVELATNRPNAVQVVKSRSTGKIYKKTTVDGTALYNEVKLTKD